MDKIELQRLIDGELDHAQRQRLLCQIDDEQPTQWRMIGLALLEEQALRREFVAQRDFQAQQLARLKSQPEAHAACRESSGFNISIKRWASMALAACLLIGLGFAGGNWLGSHFNPSSPTQSMATSPPLAGLGPAPDSQLEVNETEQTLVGQLHFVSDTVSDNNDNSIQVPMYETVPDEFQQMLVTQEQQVQQWNDELRLRGYELEWRPEMLESRLPDGRAVILPISQVQLRSLGQ